MKKGEIIELIQSSQSRGIITPDVLKHAHPVIISKYIDMALNQIMFEIFKKDPSEIDAYGKWYYGQDVKSVAGRYYCDLPCGKIQLPNASSSVRKIVEENNPDSTTFVYTKPMLRGALSRVGTISRSNVITYNVDSKINFEEPFNPLITKVDIFAITPFSDLSNEEEFPIPLGQDINLIQTVFQLINLPSQETKINNG